MAQDDYFSFGDEELEGEPDLTELGHGPLDQAVALVEPADAEEVGAGEDWFGSAAERAARPRGDSNNGSSERRLPSSRRTRVLAALALGLLALILGRTAISALGGSEPVAQNASTSTARSAADLEAQRRAGAIRASRERAAEGQRARQHRAQTRRRARRRRPRIAAERHQRAKVRRPQAEAQDEASAASEVPAPEYVPPTYEVPPPSSPAPESAPEPPSEPHIQNGAHSPEFGL